MKLTKYINKTMNILLFQSDHIYYTDKHCPYTDVTIQYMHINDRNIADERTH